MHGRILGPVLGSIAVATVIAATFFGANSPTSVHSSMSSASLNSLTASSGEDEQFCPSAEEIEEHWDAYGEELKPDPGCPDLEPTSDEQAAQRRVEAGKADRHEAAGNEHHHRFEHAVPSVLTTMRQAQNVLDPENDPLVLIDRDSKGRYLAVHLVLAPGQAAPPAWVRTGDQFKSWLDQSAASSRGARR